MKPIVFLLLSGIVLLAACAAPQATPPEEPPVPTASLSETAMAEKIDDTSRPVEQTAVFLSDISKIYCCVKVSDAPDFTEVRAEWIYLGETAGTSGTKIGEYTLTVSGNQYLHFSEVRSAPTWQIGNYEVRLYLNGEEKTAVPFEVVAPPPEPDVKKLLVLHMEAWTTGTTFWAEGTVKNVGNVPLHDVQLEVAFLDEDNNLVKTVQGPLEPTSIDVGETAHASVEKIEASGLKRYDYRFILPSGESIPFSK